MADTLSITDLKAWALREPRSGRRYTVVRVDTAAGLKGYGECGEVTARDFAAAKAALKGVDASAYEVAWRKPGNAASLRAAVNMAQLDILGKATKAPAYQVLGGPTRTKVRTYTTLDGPGALERAMKDGYRAFAVQVPEPEWRNSGKSYATKATTLMDRLRRATGPDHDFVLDGGAKLVAGDAQTVAAELEKFHLLWFDEPTKVANLSAIKKISGESVTPLGFGRTLTGAGEFQDLLREDAVDILRPSLATHGISMIRRIAVLAETYYVAVAPFHDGGPVGTAAAFQLAASIPNFFIQHIPSPQAQEDRDMRRAIAGDLEKSSLGFAALPTGPGLGINVDEAALARFEERA